MLALIERDGYKCAICGSIDDLTIDHLVPLSKGGSDDLPNLRILCRPHNSVKSDTIEAK
jgi:5-methylcytosine-specific restriction endonuclease McrA